MNMLITQILHYIILLSTISGLLIISHQLLGNLATKSKDIFQYKIKNWNLSINITLSYIGFFILFLYGLRIYNLPRAVYIKELIKQIHIPLEFIYNHILLTILFALNVLMFIILLLLLFVNVYKRISQHIFNIWLYYYYPMNNTKSKVIGRLKDKLLHIGDEDLILFTVYQISNKLTLWLDQGDFKRTNYPWYRIDAFINKMLMKLVWNKRYQLFITLSPLIVLLYDCVFNNLVVTHVFYYLILYVPLILLRKISSNIATESWYICDLLWCIFYKKESCIYAISQKDKKLLDLYMLSGLRSDVDLGLEAEMYLLEVSFLLKQP